MKWATSLLLASALLAGAHAFAQAPDGTMSETEIESLRSTKAVPMDRIAAFVKILDDRDQRINTLIGKPHKPAFASDMHDALEEFGSIADELNDNLDEYDKALRDVRKVLPRLIAATERWSTSLRAAGNDDHYTVVQRIALNTLKDTHDLAVEMQEAQEKYFKEHPEAAKI